MHRRHIFPHRSAQQGIALFVGLVFLVVLSLVAVVAMRGTLLELRMVNNVAAHERAFEVSESLRGIPVAMFDDHTFNRGWPTALMGGNVADTGFGTFPHCSGTKAVGSKGLSCDMLDGTTVRSDDSGLVNLYEIAFKDGEHPYDPATWTTSTEDLTVEVCNSGECTSGGKAQIWIRPDGSALSAGNGAAQAAGYRGEGSGSATGGGSMYFQILSRGSANGMTATTLAQYRQRISN
ncbi:MULTISPECIES: PilX N-terminal domain-containing pilus assembly protein [Dyella]|uniref:Type 4 fimbrial biogenesis protein PilX N-terminal domain-containing protein n=2 Tax=Dyella TaxID=231454 RepID=A0A4R0YTF5_9GAMM|nr:MULTISPECIES: PilX N-terminal domain-containing pilus assembly protein [Dyella]TBR39755.1 hypothetical protein EYV96_06090 [Dyella terrae]TCI12663.1 hypothetical protein EZM97_04780 [Dyella soli]